MKDTRGRFSRVAKCEFMVEFWRILRIFLRIEFKIESCDQTPIFFSPLKNTHPSFSRVLFVTYDTVRSVHTCVNSLLRPAKMVALFEPSRSLAHCRRRRGPPRLYQSSPSPAFLLFSFSLYLFILVALKWLHFWRHTRTH